MLESFNKAEKQLKPSPDTLFTDVYDKMPENLKKQMAEMKQQVKQYPEHYPVKTFSKMED